MDHPHSSPRVTAYLSADHARLDALLDRACSSAVFDREAFALFRAGLLRHIGIEERLLFPAARAARSGEQLAAARVLRVEHAAIASLLATTPDLALAHELRARLTQHDSLEERAGGVYEECDRIIGEARSLELAKQAMARGEGPVAPHFDGPTVLRTATAALEHASRKLMRR